MVVDNKELYGRITKGYAELRKTTNPSYCFYAKADCSEKFIRAHSIQKSKILKKISDSNHILFFQSSFDENHLRRFEPRNLGIDKATIFTGFCEKHDSELFKCIEEEDYEVGNQEQEFLFAYRALAKEHHTKLNVMWIYDSLCKWIKGEDLTQLKKYFFIKEERDFEVLKWNEKQVNFTLKEIRQSMKNLEERRIAMNKNLDDENYYKINTVVIEYSNEYPISACDCFTLEKDFRGNIINDLTNLNIKLKFNFVTIFPQNGKTYILLSYLKKDRDYFRFIKDQILDEPGEQQKVLITNILLKHLENFAISPFLWDKLSETKRGEVTKVFSSNILFTERDLSKIEDINLFV